MRPDYYGCFLRLTWKGEQWLSLMSCASKQANRQKWYRERWQLLAGDIGLDKSASSLEQRTGCTVSETIFWFIAALILYSLIWSLCLSAVVLSKVIALISSFDHSGLYFSQNMSVSLNYRMEGSTDSETLELNSKHSIKQQRW